MERNILRGSNVIGTIVYPSEAGASVFGLEVLATSVVPSEDDDNQFESNEAAERFLNQRWDAHCRALGTEPEPQAAPAPEFNEEAAYYAREAAQEQHEIAVQDAAVEREDMIHRQVALAQQDVLSTEERAELLRITTALLPIVESSPVPLAPVVADEDFGDLPF